MDGDARRQSERLRGAGRTGVPLRQRIADARALERLVLDHGRETARLPGALGGRRRVNQNAVRSRAVAEMARQGEREVGALIAKRSRTATKAKPQMNTDK